MPGMGNELYRAKKKLEEQEIINQELQKKHISSMTEQYFTVLYLAFILQNIPNAKITTVMIFCNSVKQYVPGYCYAQDGEGIGSLEEKTGGARIY